MHPLVITDVLLQSWENEKFQVTLISLELITRASPRGTDEGKCISMSGSPLFIDSPHLPLLKADRETGKCMDNQLCLGNWIVACEQCQPEI